MFIFYMNQYRFIYNAIISRDSREDKHAQLDGQNHNYMYISFYKAKHILLFPTDQDIVLLSPNPAL